MFCVGQSFSWNRRAIRNRLVHRARFRPFNKTGRKFGYDFPPEYADLVRIVNGGLESDEFQLAYVPDPESEVDQLRRKAQREDLLQLNHRMRDSHGNAYPP